MNKEQPLASFFVISVYNEENFILNSLDSVLSQNIQKYRNKGS